MHYAFRAAAALTAAALIASEASAGILATAAKASNFTSTSTTGVAVPLNSGGATSLKFKTNVANQLVVITYNAECGALGSSASNWTSVRILVDGVEAQPNSSTSFAMCTASAGAGTSNYAWVGASRQSVITVPSAGKHNVQVLAYVQGGTSLWLGDSSLFVED